MYAKQAPQPHRPPKRRARAPLSVADRVRSVISCILSAWRALRFWFQANTVAPAWLPVCWRHPLSAYGLSLLAILIAAGLTLLLVVLFPGFELQGILLTAGVVLIALTWGLGPSLLATLISLALLCAALATHFSWELRNMDDWVGMVVLLLGSVGVSLLTSQSRRARRQAEELARSLKQEQVRAERERLRLRTLLDVLPAAVGMLDAQAQMIETNPANQALWGEGVSSPDKLARFQTWEGWWPDTGKLLAPEEWAIMRALTSGETILNQEVEIEPIPGQRKVILDSTVPIRDETGAVIGAVGILQDITERKRLEKALRQAEREAAERAAQLETIFESIVDGVVVTDRQQRVIHMNRSLKTLLGMQRDPKGWTMPQLEALEGFSLRNAQGQPLPAAERPITRSLWGEVLTKEQSVDLLLRTRDGREIQLNNTGAPICDAAGQIIGCVEVVRDVTEQRRLQQRTRDTLNALLAMAESLVQGPEIANTSDPASNAPLVARARHLAELTRSALGCRCVAIAAVEAETAAMMPITAVGLMPEQEQRWATCERQECLSERICPDVLARLRAGELVTLNAARQPFQPWQAQFPVPTTLLVPMRIGETLVGLLAIDDTAEKEIERSQEEAALISAVARLGALALERERLLREHADARVSELALRETQAQMESFLGMAGHELKNPLAALKLGVQVTERRLQRQARPGTTLPPDFFTKHLEQARHQVGRLERLVNDLLDVSRVRAGKLELSLEPADLGAIVRQAVEEQRQAEPARTLLVQFPADRRVPIVADADRVGQVVTNYLTNALKYSPADRSVEVGLHLEDQQACVWVRDDGPGVPLEEQERVWERFHRVKGIEVQSGTGVGLGLGLYVCRTIIERHQGQVGVVSAPGAGSTFWFTLPLAV